MSSSTMKPSTGVAAVLANMKVRTKISLGFGLLLVLLSGVGGMGYYALNNIGNSFDTFARRTAIMADAEMIEKEFANLRRYAGEFATTGADERAEKAEEAGKHVKAAAAAAWPPPSRRNDARRCRISANSASNI